MARPAVTYTSLQLPVFSGTNPASAQAGQLRYNDSTGNVEVYDGSSWNVISGGGGGIGGSTGATDNAVLRADGAGGATLQSSLVTISDTGSISLPSGETVDGRDISADWTTSSAHFASTSNPHATTAAQVGLGSVTNDAQLKRSAGDFATFATKTTPAATDIVLIEDSASGNAKKQTTAAALAGIATRSEFFAAPDSPNVNDYEANSSTLPAFTLYDINTTTPAIVVPASGIDFRTAPSVGNCRIEANKSGRRSYILFQAAAENRWWFYGFKINLSGTSGWVIRSRVFTHTHSSAGTGSANNAADCALMVCKDNAGAPHLASAGSPQAGFVLGWEIDANAPSIEVDAYVGGVVTSVLTTANVFSGYSQDWEMVAVLGAGASTTQWDFFLRSPGITYHVPFGTGITGAGQGNDVWVGWRFNAVEAIYPSTPIVGSDYLRFETTAAGFIP